MANTRTPEFDSLYSGVSEEQIDQMVASLKERRKKYLIAWIVGWLIGGTIEAIFPAFGMGIMMLFLGIPCGCFVYCYNTICVLESRGHKKSGGIVSFLLLIPGAIFVPWIVLFVLGKLPKLGVKVLGF